MVERVAWCAWLLFGLACAAPELGSAPESSSSETGSETETETETTGDTIVIVDCAIATRVVVGNVNVESDEQMAALADVIEIQGDLNIRYDTLTELVGANCLESITGYLRINDNPALERIDDALTALQVSHSLDIMDNPALVSLTGLSSLEHVESRMLVTDNPALVDMRFDALSVVGENMDIHGESLPNLLGLSSLTEVGGNLSIRHCAALVDLDGLQNLTTVGGQFFGGLEILGNNALLSLDGITMQDPRSLRIAENPALVDLSGLESVVTIEDNLVIERNDTLTSLVGLGNLVEVHGSEPLAGVSIVENPALQSLAGLEGLGVIDDHLHVCNNAQLDDLSALAGLDTLSRFTVIYNDALPGTEPDAIASGLPGIEWVKIDANGMLDPLWWDKNPCPWSGDHVCDEDFEFQGHVGGDCTIDCCDIFGPTHLCADGTDDDCADEPFGP